MRAADVAGWPRQSSSVIVIKFRSPVPAGEVTLEFDRPLGREPQAIFHTHLTARRHLNIGGESSGNGVDRIPIVPGQPASVTVTLAEGRNNPATLKTTDLKETPKVILRLEGQSDQELKLNSAKDAFVANFNVPREIGEHDVQIIVRFPGLLQILARPLVLDVKEPVTLSATSGAVTGDRVVCPDCPVNTITIPYRSSNRPAAVLQVPVALSPGSLVGPLNLKLTAQPPAGMTIHVKTANGGSVKLDPDNKQTLELGKATAGKFIVEITVAGADLRKPLVVPNLIITTPAAGEQSLNFAPLGEAVLTIQVPQFTVHHPNGDDLEKQPLNVPLLSSSARGAERQIVVVDGLLESEQIGPGDLTLNVEFFTTYALNPVQGGDGHVEIDLNTGIWGFLTEPWRCLLVCDGTSNGELTFRSRQTGRKSTILLTLSVTLPSYLGYSWLLALGLAEIMAVLQFGFGFAGVLSWGWWNSPRNRFPTTAVLKVRHDIHGVTEEHYKLRNGSRMWSCFAVIPFQFQFEIKFPLPQRYADQYLTLEPAPGGVRLMRRPDYGDTLRVDRRRTLIANYFRNNPAADCIELNWGTVLRDDERNITLVLSNGD
jgi:hypothetical protein